MSGSVPPRSTPWVPADAGEPQVQRNVARDLFGVAAGYVELTQEQESLVVNKILSNTTMTRKVKDQTMAMFLDKCSTIVMGFRLPMCVAVRTCAFGIMISDDLDAQQLLKAVCQARDWDPDRLEEQVAWTNRNYIPERGETDDNVPGLRELLLSSEVSPEDPDTCLEKLLTYQQGGRELTEFVNESLTLFQRSRIGDHRVGTSALLRALDEERTRDHLAHFLHKEKSEGRVATMERACAALRQWALIHALTPKTPFTGSSLTNIVMKHQDWARNVKCHKCGKKGHFRRDCPSKRQKAVEIETQLNNLRVIKS